MITVNPPPIDNKFAMRTYIFVAIIICLTALFVYMYIYSTKEKCMTGTTAVFSGNNFEGGSISIPNEENVLCGKENDLMNVNLEVRDKYK